MKRVMTILRVELFLSVFISVVIVILYETQILYSGVLYGNKNVEFILTSLMELLTICLIPLSLRLFKFKKIHSFLVSLREKALLKWGSIRMSLLCVPMIINTLLYYLYNNVAFVYMAIIGLISLAFIYPTLKRCLFEVTM